MTDRLLSFVQHPLGRRIARALGLPQPVPLLRRHDAWQDQELAGRLLSVIAPGSAAPMPSLLAAIAAQGGTAAGDAPASALVIDATGCRDDPCRTGTVGVQGGRPRGVHLRGQHRFVLLSRREPSAWGLRS